MKSINHDAIVIARSIKEAYDARIRAQWATDLVMRDIYQHRATDWLEHANKAIDEWNVRYADAPERGTLSWFSCSERKHDHEVWAFLTGKLA